MARRGIGRLRAGGSGFSPASLFSAGEQGLWLDFSDASTLFQDSAGTTPAVLTQPVGRINDKSGNGNHFVQGNSAARGVWEQDASGFYRITMDGFDDYLASAATLNLSTTDKVTVIVGVLKVSDAVASVVAEHSANTNTTDGAFYVTAPHTAAANYGASTRGTITNTSGAAPASFAAGTPRVVTLVANNGGGTQANILKIRVNSVAQTLAFTGTTSAGNYGNLTSYLGSRAGTSAFFNGGIYQYVIFPRNLNASELALAERFVGSKMGIAL